MKPKPKKMHGRSSSKQKSLAGPAASTRRDIANGCAQVPHTDTVLTAGQITTLKKFEWVYQWMLICYMRNGVRLSRLP